MPETGPDRNYSLLTIEALREGRIIAIFGSNRLRIMYRISSRQLLCILALWALASMASAQQPGGERAATEARSLASFKGGDYRSALEGYRKLMEGEKRELVLSREGKILAFIRGILPGFVERAMGKMASDLRD